MRTKAEINPGDWVRLTPILPGIWKVYRVLAGFKEHEWVLNAPSKTSRRVLIFCHRLVNDAWKRSFSHNCCEVSLVSAITQVERNSVDALLLSDGKLQKAFEQYREKNNRIDCVANLGFGKLSKKVADNFVNLCDEMFAARIGEGLTIREVLLVLQEHGVLGNMGVIPQQVTLQLTCINYELRGDEFVYRQSRTLPF